MSNMNFKMIVKEIKAVDFLNASIYEENPVQRDHLKRLNSQHLKGEFSAPQRLVNVALLGKRKIVLDGHSRRAAWDKGQLTLPQTLVAVFYKVNSLTDVIELYKHFDSRVAVEKPSDLFETARKESGVVMQSVMMNQSLKTTLEIAEVLNFGKKSKKELTAMILTYKDALAYIDEFEFILSNKNLRKVFCAGTKAAMIVSIHKALECGIESDVAGFWEDLYNMSETDSPQVIKTAYRTAMQCDRGTGAITELGGKMLEFVSKYVEDCK